MLQLPPAGVAMQFSVTWTDLEVFLSSFTASLGFNLPLLGKLILGRMSQDLQLRPKIYLRDSEKVIAIVRNIGRVSTEISPDI